MSSDRRPTASLWLARVRAALSREPSAEERALAEMLFARCAGMVHAGSFHRAPTEEGNRVQTDLGAGMLSLAPDHRLVVGADSEVYTEKEGSPAGASLARALAKLGALGARPVAAEAAIRAGEPGEARNATLLRRAVEEISAYAREAGLALLGGDVAFDTEYDGRCFIDSIAIGALASTSAPASRSPAPGDLIVLLSPQTEEASIALRPRAWHALFALRAGILREDLAVSGLVAGGGDPLCAALELARLGFGVDLETKVVRPAEAAPVLERILLTTAPEAFGSVEALARDHAVAASVLGRVTERDLLRVVEGQVENVALPITLLRDPLKRSFPSGEEEGVEEGNEMRLADFPEPHDYEQTFRKLMRSPNLCSRRPIHERFDHYLGAQTVLHPGARASVVRVGRGNRESLVMSLAGNPRFALLDPYVGCCIAVCEAIRRLVATGADPIGIVATPSFGRSGDPALPGHIDQGLTGIRDAAQAFGVPWSALHLGVAGSGEAAPGSPIPTVAAFGRLVAQRPLTPWLKSTGDALFLLGRSREEIAGSELVARVHARVEGSPPWVDFDAERQLKRVVLAAAENHLLSSAHDLSRGGLARALVASCCATPEGIPVLGARIRIEESIRTDAYLFGESQGRMLVSVRRENSAALRDLAGDADLPIASIGEVTAGVLELGELVGLPVSEVKEAWEGTLAEVLGSGVGS